MPYLQSLLNTGVGTYNKKKLTSSVKDRQAVMPNVVIYDFVNDTTSAEIVALNNNNLMVHDVGKSIYENWTQEEIDEELSYLDL